MKTIKNASILILILLLAFYIGFKSNKVEIVKTKTETVTKYDTITKTIDNTKPTKIEKVYIKVTDTVRDTKTEHRIIYKDKEVSKYTYVDSLENGRIESTIIADTIYKRDVKLEVFNKTTQQTITNTVVKSSVMLGVDTNIMQGVQQSSLNLYFVNKDRYIVKGGFGFDFKSNNAFWSVGIAIKL
jgi:hypothetical protein